MVGVVRTLWVSGRVGSCSRGSSWTPGLHQPLSLALTERYPILSGVLSFCFLPVSVWTAKRVRAGPLSWLPAVSLGPKAVLAHSCYERR